MANRVKPKLIQSRLELSNHQPEDIFTDPEEDTDSEEDTRLHRYRSSRNNYNDRISLGLTQEQISILFNDTIDLGFEIVRFYFRDNRYEDASHYYQDILQLMVSRRVEMQQQEPSEDEIDAVNGMCDVLLKLGNPEASYIYFLQYNLLTQNCNHSIRQAIYFIGLDISFYYYHEQNYVKTRICCDMILNTIDCNANPFLFAWVQVYVHLLQNELHGILPLYLKKFQQWQFAEGCEELAYSLVLLNEDESLKRELFQCADMILYLLLNTSFNTSDRKEDFLKSLEYICCTLSDLYQIKTILFQDYLCRLLRVVMTVTPDESLQEYSMMFFDIIKTVLNFIANKAALVYIDTSLMADFLSHCKKLSLPNDFTQLIESVEEKCAIGANATKRAAFLLPSFSELFADISNESKKRKIENVYEEEVKENSSKKLMSIQYFLN